MDKDTKEQEQHIDILKIKNFDNKDTAQFIRNYNGAPEILRPISAPPPGLYENQFEETLPGNDVRMRPEYYYYYYSQKPLDPRLPKPLYKPPTHGNKFQTYLDQKNMMEMKAKDEDELKPSEESPLGVGPSPKGLDAMHSINMAGGNGPVPMVHRPQPQQPMMHHGGGGGGHQIAKPKKFYKTGPGGPEPPQHQPPMHNKWGQPQVVPFVPMGMPGMPHHYPGQPDYGYNGGYNMGYAPQQDMYGGYGYPQPQYMMGPPQRNDYYPQQHSPMYPSPHHGQQGGYSPYQQNQGMGGFGGGGGGYQQHHEGGGHQKRGAGPGGAGGQGPKNQQFQKPANIEFILSKCLEKCKDSQGSRIIQSVFETGDESEKTKLYEAVKPHLEELTKDLFGNYVIQKILEKGSQSQKDDIYALLKSKMEELSQHTYGCRVVQKALEEAKSNKTLIMELISTFKGHTMETIQDPNGNHVIQKCFECVPVSDLEFIVKEVEANVTPLLTDACGCRVIQKILEFSDPNLPRLNKIYKELMQNIFKLCLSPFGNYIIQHILVHGPEDEKSQILKITNENFSMFSRNKFASNITEKALTYSNDQFRKDVLETLNKADEGGKEIALCKVMKHEFGNYVIQKLIELSTKDMRKTIRKMIESSDVAELKANNYSKHVLNLLDKQDGLVPTKGGNYHHA